MCVSLLADTAPQHSMAGFALVMAASLAVYLQLMASLSKLLPLTVSGQQGYCSVCVCVSGHRQEFRADKTAAQCSGSYAEGGLDHFRKRIQLDSVLQYEHRPCR